VLLLITFFLHIVVMNAMLGGSMIALFTELARGSKGAPDNKGIAVYLPYAIAFTVNIGVAPLLFLQVLYGHFMYTSSILMAVYWLSIIGILIIAYYCAYIYDFKFDALPVSRTFFIAATTILLLVIGFFFTNNMSMMARPDTWLRYFSNPFGTLLNFVDATLIPRYLHFVAASVALGGLFKAHLAAARKNESPEQKKRQVDDGLQWFTWATVLQMAVGVWFLVSLPDKQMRLFMGGDGYATLLLVAGTFGAAAAIVFSLQGKLRPATAAALATVALMVLMRDQLRRSFLEPYFSPDQLTVVPQYSPLLAFLLTFVTGLAVIAYMLKLAASAGKEA
jgi:hypothetical protein